MAEEKFKTQIDKLADTASLSTRFPVLSNLYQQAGRVFQVPDFPTFVDKIRNKPENTRLLFEQLGGHYQMPAFTEFEAAVRSDIEPGFFTSAKRNVAAAFKESQAKQRILAQLAAEDDNLKSSVLKDTQGKPFAVEPDSPILQMVEAPSSLGEFVSTLGKAAIGDVVAKASMAKLLKEPVVHLDRLLPDSIDDEGLAGLLPGVPAESRRTVYGMLKGGLRVASGILSPENAMLMFTLVGAPAAMQRIISAAFAADLASELPEQVGVLREGIREGDEQKIGEGIAGIIGQGGMAALLGKHALTKAPDVVVTGAHRFSLKGARGQKLLADKSTKFLPEPDVKQLPPPTPEQLPSADKSALPQPSFIPAKGEVQQTKKASRDLTADRERTRRTLEAETAREVQKAKGEQHDPNDTVIDVEVHDISELSEKGIIKQGAPATRDVLSEETAQTAPIRIVLRQAPLKLVDDPNESRPFALQSDIPVSIDNVRRIEVDVDQLPPEPRFKSWQDLEDYLKRKTKDKEPELFHSTESVEDVGSIAREGLRPGTSVELGPTPAFSTNTIRLVFEAPSKTALERRARTFAPDMPFFETKETVGKLKRIEVDFDNLMDPVDVGALEKSLAERFDRLSKRFSEAVTKVKEKLPQISFRLAGLIREYIDVVSGRLRRNRGAVLDDIFAQVEKDFPDKSIREQEQIVDQLIKLNKGEVTIASTDPERIDALFFDKPTVRALFKDDKATRGEILSTINDLDKLDTGSPELHRGNIVQKLREQLKGTQFEDIPIVPAVNTPEASLPTADLPAEVRNIATEGAKELQAIDNGELVMHQGNYEQVLNDRFEGTSLEGVRIVGVKRTKTKGGVAETIVSDTGVPNEPLAPNAPPMVERGSAGERDVVRGPAGVRMSLKEALKIAADRTGEPEIGGSENLPVKFSGNVRMDENMPIDDISLEIEVEVLDQQRGGRTRTTDDVRAAKEEIRKSRRENTERVTNRNKPRDEADTVSNNHTAEKGRTDDDIKSDLEVKSGIIQRLKEYAERFKSMFQTAMDLISVQSPFNRIHAVRTGLAFKNYFSVRALHEEEAITAARRAAKAANYDPNILSEAVLAAEDTAYLRSLPTELQLKVEPVVKILLDYMQKGRDEYARFGMKLDFKEHVRKVLTDQLNRARATGDAELENATRQALSELKSFNFVHIPVAMLFENGIANGNLATNIAHMFTVLNAHKRTTFKIKDLVDLGLIDKEQINAVDVIMNYGRRLGKDAAALNIVRAAIRDGLAKKMPSSGKPDEGFVRPLRGTPILKGFQVHPMLNQALDGIVNYREGLGFFDKALTTWKMAKFYNPVVLPWYDAQQAAIIGTLNPFRPFKTSKYFVEGFRDVINQTDTWRTASENGAFSTPFRPPFRTWAELTEYLKTRPKDRVAKLILDTAKLKANVPYKVIMDMAQNSAWFMDQGMRMATFRFLKDKGLSDAVAGQITAYAHGDYASVPPEVRRVLNRIFFTPTFKIVMGKLHVRLTQAALGRIDKDPLFEAFQQDAPKVQKVLRAGLLRMAAVNVATHMVMVGLGFEAVMFGVRYRRRVRDENGEQKDLTITIATPANIGIKYASRAINTLRPGTNPALGTFINSMQWEIQPLYRDILAIAKNERPDGSLIYNPTGTSFKFQVDKALSVIDYLLETSFPLVGAGQEVLGLRNDMRAVSTKVLERELGRVEATLLRLIAFPNLTTPKELIMKRRLENVMQTYKKMILDAHERGGALPKIDYDRIRETLKGIMDENDR